MARQALRAKGAILLTSAGVIAAVAGPMLAEPMTGGTRGTYGTPGLIDMPTAEARPDGEIGITHYRTDTNTQRNSFTFQIAPRVSGAFRYSRVPGVYKAGPGGSYIALYDRSFDVQVQLLDESAWRPSVALGLRDFIGTGVYSSEYLVATKSFSPRLRATLGLGWGRLGSNGGVSGAGERPPYDHTSRGGQLNSAQWFKGDIAPFAGLAWSATDKLTLKAEYSSDAYIVESARDTINQRTAVNLGVDYAISPDMHLAGYLLHGDQLGVQLTFNIDPHKALYPSGRESAPLPVRPRPAPGADPEGWSGAWSADPTAQPAIQGALGEALAKDGIRLEAMALSAGAAEVRVRNERYPAAPQAIGRTLRAMSRALPPSVETLTVTLVERGMPVSSTTLARRDLEQLENGRSGEILARAAITDAAAAPRPEGMVPSPEAYPRLQWAFGPYFDTSFFDPDQPVKIDVGLQFKARYEIAPGLMLGGTVRQKVVGNLDAGERNSNSVLPHVRSDAQKYNEHGDLTISDLTAAWYARPAESLYSRVTVGLLERMYGGVSGELLWKPVDSRLALGVETAWARQRAFDQRFDFRDYETVTGHVSAYYDFGKGYWGQVDAGRYLAKDWGTTVSFNREFANGWRVGAFATFTDVSAEDFGEGSFDKGITFTIPLTWGTGTPTLTTSSGTIRPITRDGGAKLRVEGRLYETIRGDQTGKLYNEWGRFWR